MSYTWCDLKGYEGIYQICKEGLIKSFPKKMSTRHGTFYYTKERIIYGCINPTTRYTVVRLIRDGVSKLISLHILLAKNFLIKKKSNTSESYRW